MGSKRTDLTGKRFGMLTVMAFAGALKSRKCYWLCKCDCGTEKLVRGSCLTQGDTISCGCRKRQTGEKHYKWDFSKSAEERTIKRAYPEYAVWRRAVYSRDHYTCQRCGCGSHKLVAHHLEGYAYNIELRTNVDNGVTLCEHCHKEFHRLYGTKNNTKDQYDEWRDDG